MMFHVFYDGLSDKLSNVLGDFFSGHLATRDNPRELLGIGPKADYFEIDGSAYKISNFKRNDKDLREIIKRLGIKPINAPTINGLLPVHTSIPVSKEWLYSSSSEPCMVWAVRLDSNTDEFYFATEDKMKPSDIIEAINSGDEDKFVHGRVLSDIRLDLSNSVLLLNLDYDLGYDRRGLYAYNELRSYMNNFFRIKMTHSKATLKKVSSCVKTITNEMKTVTNPKEILDRIKRLSSI